MSAETMDSAGSTELSRLFVEESKESLMTLEKDLIILETLPDSFDSDLMNRIFRAVHSIKGSSGFLGLTNFKRLSHAMENVLGRIRKRELMPTKNLVTTLLRSKDVLTAMIYSLEDSNDMDITTLLTELKEALIPSQNTETRHPGEAKLPNGKRIFTLSPDAVEKARSENVFIYLLEYDMDRDINGKGKSTTQVLQELQNNGMSIIESLSLDGFYVLATNPLEPEMVFALLDIDFDKIHVVFDPEELVSPIAPAACKIEQKEEREIPAPTIPPVSRYEMEDSQPQVFDSGVDWSRPQELLKREQSAGRHAVDQPKDTIKVRLKALDTLMSLAGELVLTRNQLLQNIRTWDKRGIEISFQRLNLITSEVQESIMSTRMQPIENIFSRFNRLVRDLAMELGKKIEIIVEGEDVELDKTVIESIADPLTHLIRNCVDHGIETPGARENAGKPITGTIRLSAFHEAGQVKIIITDDGAGINIDEIKQKALKSGILTVTKLNDMQEDEIIRLIFLPGFSTAKNVTDISGRGVGMDVVASNLSRIGGVVDVKTKAGEWTTFEIRLPLTLAIIPSLIVSVKDERFAIPQVNMVELVRVPPARVAEEIQKIGGAVVLRLRGELLPLVSLQDVLGIQSLEAGGENVTLEGLIRCPSCINIAIVAMGELRYGIAVDSFAESEEIVVKPLGRHLRNCRPYAGATIEGTGRVSLILDVLGICRMMNLAEVKEIAEKTSVKQKEESPKVSRTFLIVKNEGIEQFAVPLTLVSRIERIHKSNMEKVAGKLSLRHNDSVISLHSLDEFVPTAKREDSDYVYVVVIRFAEKEMGFVVSEVIDILETDSAIDEVTFRQPGISGSFTAFDRITLILDLSVLIPAMLRPAGRMEHIQRAGRAQGVKETQSIALIADDSEFFATQIDAILRGAGYATILARDGLEALGILEKNHVDILVTDIEMPNLDGLSLAKEIRRISKLADLPIIALTSVAGDQAIQRGFEAGVDEYLIKLDGDLLLEKLEYHLTRRKKYERV